MDLATSLTKKVRKSSVPQNQISEKSSIGGERSSIGSSPIKYAKSRVQTSSQNRNEDFKLTSLPFHQFHKQTYNAFKSPLNGSFQGSTANSQKTNGLNDTKLEKEQLDQLYDTLNRFYQSEKQNQHLKTQLQQLQSQLKEDSNIKQKLRQNKELKEYLIQQIVDKQFKKSISKQHEIAKDQQYNSKFQTVDTNLVSVFPKITETPKHQHKRMVKDQQNQYNQQLQEQIKNNKLFSDLERQREIFENHQTMKHENNFRNKNDQTLNDMRYKYQEQAKKEWEANMRAKNIKNKVDIDVDKLQYEIIHGKYMNSPSRLSKQTEQNFSRIDQSQAIRSNDLQFYKTNFMNESNHQNIFHDSSNGINDGNRFLNHNKKNLNSCNFLTQAGPINNRTPRTLYQENFINSRGFYNRQSLNHSVESFHDIIEVESSQDHDDEGDDIKGGVDKMQTVVQEQVFEEDQLTNDQNNTINDQTIQDNNGNEDQENDNQAIDQNLELKKNIIDESGQAYSGIKNERSRMPPQNINSHQSGKLSKNNLDRFNHTLFSTKSNHFRGLSETASTISSKLVQEKVKKFTQQVIPPSLAQQELNLNNLQFDALQRFLKQLEDEAIDIKRAAKVQRQNNREYDKRVVDEEKHIQNVKQTFKKNILQQIKQNSIQNKEMRHLDLTKPHIEGNEGYPPRPEPTREEAHLHKKVQQQITKINLETQMKEKELMNKTMGHFNKTEQLKDIFDTQKKLNEEAMTTKNKYLNRKQELDDIWQKTQKIKSLKKKLQNELGISFNDDKIKQMMQYSYGNEFFTPKRSQALSLEQMKEQEYADQKQRQEKEKNITRQVYEIKKRANLTTAGSLINSQYITNNEKKNQDSETQSTQMKSKMNQEETFSRMQSIQKKIEQQRDIQSKYLNQRNKSISTIEKSGLDLSNQGPFTKLTPLNTSKIIWNAKQHQDIRSQDRIPWDEKFKSHNQNFNSTKNAMRSTNYQ
ncbi:UNKNOWN [Stylonychia lemnae]|uniref:Uncharacterized protein n=1 Tax=Stylonychia lemnae TaxID=5949 RepID=A0A078AMN4_STYLE|nr:UNKNOWN [Stylonychia lemnae]|eukprot:CDW83176.1 UNKNOWN [Stylonychia lemnae]